MCVESAGSMSECEHLGENLRYVAPIGLPGGRISAVIVRCLVCSRELQINREGDVSLHGGPRASFMSASAPCPEKDELRPPHSGMSL
jgi:hypothetical protein